MLKKIKRLVFLIIIVVIAFVGIYIHKGYKLYEEAISKTSIVQMKEKVIKDTKNYTYLKDIPDIYKNAVVAVEDRRFYLHNGIDIICIGRAIIVDIKEMSLIEGGSTITQQLAKNTYFTQSKKIDRKIAEIFMAFEYEKNLTKEEILELYINTCYYGDGYYNISDAAKGYFNKEVKEMSDFECTLLAGIPNAPSVYAPTKNYDLCKKRQAQVLKKMVRSKYITEERAEELKKEEYTNGR